MTMRWIMVVVFALVVACGDEVTSSADAVPGKQAAAGAEKPTPRALIAEVETALRNADIMTLYGLLSKEQRDHVDATLNELNDGPARELIERAAAKGVEAHIANDLQHLGLKVIGVQDNIVALRIENSRGGAFQKTWKVAFENGRWLVDDRDLGSIVFTLAQPGVSRRNANESMAIATLRNIASAQAQLQASARADVNENGVGEYGTFAEMAAVTGVRGGKMLNPPVLSPAFRHIKSGQIHRSGYVFAIYLPGKDGAGLKELSYGGADKKVDPAAAETTWCCYAWPEEHGKTGKRTFFINQTGDILATEDKRYSGDTGPVGASAFRSGATGIRALTDPGAKANDGNVWKRIN